MGQPKPKVRVQNTEGALVNLPNLSRFAIKHISVGSEQIFLCLWFTTWRKQQNPCSEAQAGVKGIETFWHHQKNLHFVTDFPNSP